ncbi:hypothetical protein GCM10020001_115270 [Nonomuraea salmonea]
MAVGALVHARTVVPDEYFVPPHTIALDAPVRLLAPGDPGLAEAVSRVGFAQVAFGVDTEWTDRITRYEHIAEVRVAEFGTHADDEILPPPDDPGGSVPAGMAKVPSQGAVRLCPAVPMTRTMNGGEVPMDALMSGLRRPRCFRTLLRLASRSPRFPRSGRW